MSATHVEVRLNSTDQPIPALRFVLTPAVNAFLKSNNNLPHNVAFKPDLVETDPSLVASVLLERDCGGRPEIAGETKAFFHFYKPHAVAATADSGLFDGAVDADGAAVVDANHVLLPSNKFVGLWETLIFEKGLKERLLKFAMSALTFSKHRVDTNLIACNRLILLHGPPGTGKTSLCKALAQKLAIRTHEAFAYTHLVEINSHSLFSKWFSESGKLVARLFAKIGELVADRNNLVCLLIDEVESLAYARSSMNSNEPRDAMRVVNALLTHLDEIKTHPNVLILATSNLAQSIDLAFLDRADLREYIGYPAVPAIRSIYKSMLVELMSAGIVECEALETEDIEEGLLTDLSERSVGLSGRTLRKLPLLAHAQYTASELFEENGKIFLSDFLDAMLLALEQNIRQHQLLKSESMEGPNPK
ncbi:GL21543 [Drosophila persimilis]|uniref:GL21543 n=1 Tax=Drosophila persimilis TaxID=7234 RepID=B4GFX1_DROPE|nr:pachytene checkpoint protein 2 homolog [Drosophila persimilis]EDW34506.1 GL21543 [Drosophila persimilis]